jgi:hypothetical protein
MGSSPASLKLTFHLDHSVGANHLRLGEAARRKAKSMYDGPVISAGKSTQMGLQALNRARYASIVSLVDPERAFTYHNIQIVSLRQPR